MCIVTDPSILDLAHMIHCDWYRVSQNYFAAFPKASLAQALKSPKKIECNSPKRTISASGGLGLLQMV